MKSIKFSQLTNEVIAACKGLKVIRSNDLEKKSVNVLGTGYVSNLTASVSQFTYTSDMSSTGISYYALPVAVPMFSHPVAA